MDILILLGSFTLLCALGLPVAYALGLAAIAFSFGGHARGPASPLERVAAGVAGALLLTADVRMAGAGLLLLAGAVAVHFGRLRAAGARTPGH